MYSANNEKFDSFLKAVAYAKANKCEVIEVGTGIRRWQPAPPASAKKIREYNERVSAHQAYVRSESKV